MIIEGGVYLIVPALKYCCGRCCGKIEKESAEMALTKLNQKSETQQKDLGLNTKQTEFEIAGDSWKGQFDIPGALVDVMYRQCIVWCGMYFSPMIPVMGTICSIWTFFVRKRFLFNHCGRPKKALGVAKQLKFFYGMMLVGIVVSFLPLKWLLDRTPECGPHQKQNVLTDTETVLDEDMPTALKVFFEYAFNGLLLLPLFVLSMVYLKYVHGKSKVYEVNGKALKEALRREKDEKKQILKDYNIRL